MRLLIGLHLAQVPRAEVDAAVGVAVRRVAPARPADEAAGLLVRAGERDRAPAPSGRAERLGAGVGRLERRRDGVGPVPHLVVGGAVRVHVPVGRVPDVRLVVEVVVPDPARAGRSVPAREVVEPRGDVGRAGLDAGVVRVVPGDIAAIRAHAVAAVGPELRVVLWLRTVLGDAEAAREVAGLRYPADERQAEDSAGAGAAVLVDEDVGLGAVGQLRRVGVARHVLEVPVRTPVRLVQGVVVARGGVAAPAPYRQPQAERERLLGEVHSVDVATDGVPVGRDVDGQGRAGRGLRGPADGHRGSGRDRHQGRENYRGTAGFVRDGHELSPQAGLEPQVHPRLRTDGAD